MRLMIDFSPRRVRISVRGLVLLCGALLALSVAGWSCFVEIDAAQKASKQRQTEKRKHVQERVTLSPEKTEAINRAIRQLNLPWEDLFAAVESKLNDQISLLSLEPDAANHLLRIQGEAKSADDMLDFVTSLNDKSYFGNASLLRHEIVDNDHNKPIRFIVEASWRPE